MKLAADQNHGAAQNNYGYCLHHGIGVPKNESEAARYFKLAADQNNKDGHYLYGCALLNGWGVVIDHIGAAIRFRHASELGLAAGQVAAGVCLFLGLGCCENLIEAEDYFKMAADQGDAMGAFNYGIAFSQHSKSHRDLSEAARYFRFAAFHDSTFGQVNYGVHLLITCDVQKDLEEAARYLMTAADKGDIYGMFSYALCLFDGKGVPSDRSKAAQLFKSVADAQYPFGEVNFGFCLHEGIGVDRNWFCSVKYFKSAADRGDRVGQFNYGLCCYKGEGVSMNWTDAAEYFRLSADQNYPPAQFAYAACIVDDQGVSCNNRQAIAFITRGSNSNVTEWDRIQRIETPISVRSLELPWLRENREKLVVNWKLEMQSFQFIKPFTELEFLASELTGPRVRSKTITIQSGVMNEKNLPDFEMDIKSFREIKVLGYGLFSAVKLMKDIYSKQFAVKYFERGIPGGDEKVAQVFSRELEAFCHLNHPCIIQVYRFSREAEKYEGALVMEYMPNGSLDHVLESVRQGNPPDFWNNTGIAIIICEIVAGMEFVHSRGMVYRDLKPANILIDGSGRIRIGDFGSAKIIEGAVYLSGNYQGTIQYQAPEIYGEDPYTGKVDVFSFALVLYEILVGRPVYPAKLSLTQIMKKVCSKIRADLPSEINDDVKTLISQCWSHNPDSRLSLSEISRNSSESNSGSFPTLIRMPLNNISLIFTVNTTNERALEESASFLTVNHHK